MLTNEEWLNKIQVKEIENEEKEKAKNNLKNKQEQKRNEAVSKKKKSVDNNQPSTSYEDYLMSENVETNEKHCSKQASSAEKKIHRLQPIII